MNNRKTKMIHLCFRCKIREKFANNGSLQELGEKFSINNDPILHFDFF